MWDFLSHVLKIGFIFRLNQQLFQFLKNHLKSFNMTVSNYDTKFEPIMIMISQMTSSIIWANIDKQAD